MFAKSIISLAALGGMAAAAGPIRSNIPTYVDGSQYNKPYGGPPGEWFAGDSSLPIGKIADAARRMTRTPKDATYIISDDNYQKATIHSDWEGFDKVCRTSTIRGLPTT